MATMTPEERARIEAYLGVTSREATLNPVGTNLTFSDADSGTAGGQQFRMLGFDAPETQHSGLDAEPLAYDARDELARQVVRSGGATFEGTGELDPYKRELGVLRGNDQRNLNEEMARSGMVNRPMFEPTQNMREAFHAANWRTGTELGNILQGDAYDVNNRVRELQRQAVAKRDRGELAPIVQKESYVPGSTWNRAWTRGVHNTAATLNGFAAALGDVTDNPEIKAWGEEGMAERIRKAAAFPAEVQDWDDVETWDQFGTFALERIGETLPQLGIDAAAFLGTGGAGVAARIGFAKALARELPEGAITKFAVNSGKTGAFAGMYGQSAGETALQLHDAGVDSYGATALATGGVKAALDYAPLVYSLRTARSMSKLSGAELGRAVGKLATSAGVEGTTEGAQTILDFLAVKAHTGQDVFSEDNIRELKTAIAAGAIMGGAVSAVGIVPPGYRAARDAYLNARGAQAAPAPTDVTGQAPQGAFDPADEAEAEAFMQELRPTTREPSADIMAQVDALRQGQKKALFLSRENEAEFEAVLQKVPDAIAIDAPEGLFITTLPLSREAYENATPAQRDAVRAKHLGYGANKQQLNPETAEVVQTVNDSNGAVVQEEATNDVPTTVAAHEANLRPGQHVEVKPVIQAVAEREERVADEQRRDDSVGGDLLLNRDAPVQSSQSPATVAGDVAGGMEAEVPVMGAPQRDIADAAAAQSGAISQDGTGEPLSVPVPGFSDAGPTGVGAAPQSQEVDSPDSGQVPPTAAPSSGGSSVAASPTDDGTGAIDTGASHYSTYPRRVIHPDDAAEVVARLRNPLDPLIDQVRLFMSQGADQKTALEHALGTEASADVDDVQESPLSDDATYSLEEVQDQLDAWDEDTYLDVEGFTEDYTIRGEVAAQDIDSAHVINYAYGKRLNGNLAKMYVAAYEAERPTYTLRFAPIGKGPSGKMEFSLVPQLKQFRTAEQAEREVARLEALYPDSRFTPEAVDGGIVLTRHKLISSLRGNTEAPTVWANRWLPKIRRQASGVTGALNKLQKRMEGDPADYQALANEYRDKARELLFVQTPDGRGEFMHTYTITESGRVLVDDLENVTNLERQYAAFMAGLSQLYQNGYFVAEADLQALAQAQFIPGMSSHSITTVAATREQAMRLSQEGIAYSVSELGRLKAELQAIYDGYQDAVDAGVSGKAISSHIRAKRKQIAATQKELAQQKRDYEALTGRQAEERDAEYISMQNSGSDMSASRGYNEADVGLSYLGDVDSTTRDELQATNRFESRGRNARPAGISIADANEAVNEFLREFPGANDVQVEYASLPADDSLDSAHYFPAENRMVVYAGNLASKEDLIATLRHELFVHKGLGFLSNTEAQQYFAELQEVINTNPTMKAVYDEIGAWYGDVSPQVQLEEMLAFIAESVDTGILPRTINRILVVVRKILRALGLVADQATFRDIELVLQEIAAGFARGQRAPRRLVPGVPTEMARLNLNPQRVIKMGQTTLSGLQKLVLPMTNGLYQLNQISAPAASLFKQYWRVRDSMRALWEGEFQNRVDMSEQEVSDAWRELNSYGEVDTLPDTATPNARKLRTFLDNFYESFIKPTMPTTGRIPNYLPQLVDINQLRVRRDEFIQKVTGFKVPWQDRPLSEEQAAGIWSRLMDNGGTYEHALEDYTGVVPPGSDHRRSRTLRSPELMGMLEQEGFLYADKREAIDHYLTVSINRGAFERVFSGFRTLKGARGGKGRLNRGRFTELLIANGQSDVAERVLNANTDLDVIRMLTRMGYLKYTAGGSTTPEVFEWYTPTQKLTAAREGVGDAQQRARFDEITHGFMGYFGARVSPEVHNIQSNILAYESILTLAFSTLSSLPDFAGPFLRVMQDQGVVASLTELRKGLGRAISGQGNAKEVARQFGLLNHRQNQAALKSMWGQEHASPTAQKLLDGLFKYNGQEWLTNQSRTLATDIGLHYFETLASAGDTQALRGYGISPDDITSWVKMNRPALTAEMLQRDPVQAALVQRVHEALHRFVDEAVIRPNAGQKPVWANDPRFAIFWHLKSFLWAYWSVIISPTAQSMIRQAKQGNYGEAAMQAAFVGLLVLPAAALGWEVRQLLQYTLFGEEQPSDSMDGFAYTAELLQRSGFGGPFQLMADAGMQEDATSGLLRISGPTLGHLATLLHGDWDEKVYRSIPVLSQLYGAQSAISDVAVGY